MSDVDYMSEITDVAVAMIPRSLGHRIWDEWLTLEEAAKKREYDVFRLPASSDIRVAVRRLATTLYEVPEASPSMDTEQIRAKNREYGGSWCKRGGTWAFNNLARKADRLETQLATCDFDLNQVLDESEDKVEHILDTLGDLRRYLILVEAWNVAYEKQNSSDAELIEEIAEEEPMPDVVGHVMVEEEGAPKSWSLYDKCSCSHRAVDHIGGEAACTKLVNDGDKFIQCGCSSFRLNAE